MNSLFSNPYIKLLFAINLLYFLIVNLLVSLGVNKSELLVNFGALSNFTLQDLNLWDVVLSNFIHLDFLHFFFNMFALIQLSKVVSQVVKNNKMLIIVYLISGIVSSFFSIAFYLILLNASFISIGASGSIFGFIGFILGLQIFYKLNGDNEGIIDTSSFYLVILFSILLSLFGVNNINHAAHFGGFFAGLCLGVVHNYIKLNAKLASFLYNSCITIFCSSLFLMILKFGINLFKL